MMGAQVKFVNRTIEDLQLSQSLKLKQLEISLIDGLTLK